MSPPPPPRNQKFANLEISSQVGLQNSKCHLELSSQVGLQISKWHLTPLPPNENLADLEISTQVGLQNSKYHSIPNPPPPPPPRNEKLADLELSSQVGLQISKCHFTPPFPPYPPPQNENLEVLSQVALQNSKCHFIPPPPHLEMQSWHFNSALQRDASPPRGDLKVCSKIHIGSVLCFEFGSRFRVQRVFVKRATKHKQLQCNAAAILDSLIARFFTKKVLFQDGSYRERQDTAPILDW